MATKSKKTRLGNYITKVNGYDIRQRVSYRKVERGRDNKGREVGSSEYVICRGNKTIQKGFKNKEAATKYAETH